MNISKNLLEQIRHALSIITGLWATDVPENFNPPLNAPKGEIAFRIDESALVLELDKQMRRQQTSRNLENVLQDLYDSEINVEIRWCWDGGFDVAIGNAYCCRVTPDAVPEAEASFKFAFEITPWLVTVASGLYPDSAFAKRYS